METKSAPEAPKDIDALFELMVSIDAKLDRLLNPKYEIQVMERTVEAGTVLDVSGMMKELGEQGYTLVESPMVGMKDSGRLVGSDGQPHKVPAAHFLVIKRVD